VKQKALSSSGKVEEMIYNYSSGASGGGGGDLW